MYVRPDGVGRHRMGRAAHALGRLATFAAKTLGLALPVDPDGLVDAAVGDMGDWLRELPPHERAEVLDFVSSAVPGFGTGLETVVSAFLGLGSMGAPGKPETEGAMRALGTFAAEYRSILTFPVMFSEVQVISWSSPRPHHSPPFGQVTLTTWSQISKFASLRSLTLSSKTLLMRTLY